MGFTLRGRLSEPENVKFNHQGARVVRSIFMTGVVLDDFIIAIKNVYLVITHQLFTSICPFFSRQIMVVDEKTPLKRFIPPADVEPTTAVFMTVLSELSVISRYQRCAAMFHFI